jgi:mannose-6-phosphate isomerase-like protein (cupin superfamily)
MLAPGQRFANERSGAQLEIVEAPVIGGRSVLEVRRLLRPGMGLAIPHVHLDYAETWCVEDGIADAVVGDRRLRWSPGDEVHIAPRTAHANPHNRSRADLVVRQRFEPATEGALSYVETLGRLMEAGRDLRGDLPPDAAMAVFDATGAGTYVARVPRLLQQRVAFPLARPIARWRGTYPPETPGEPGA